MMQATKIEWTDRVWNPFTGCRNGCEWCYARKMVYRQKGRNGYPKEDPFRPMFHPERNAQPLTEVPRRSRSRNPALKEPGRAMIFTVSMGDICFASAYELRQILWTMEQTPEHVYQVLTKRPDRLLLTLEEHPDIRLPGNLWLGVSVTDVGDIHRLGQLKAIAAKQPGILPWLSAEPLLGQLPMYAHEVEGIRWVVVGAETGNRKGRVVSEKDWIAGLVTMTTVQGIPLFMKLNLAEAWGPNDIYQAWPKMVPRGIDLPPYDPENTVPCDASPDYVDDGENEDYPSKIEIEGRPSAEEQMAEYGGDKARAEEIESRGGENF